MKPILMEAFLIPVGDWSRSTDVNGTVYNGTLVETNLRSLGVGPGETVAVAYTVELMKTVEGEPAENVLYSSSGAKVSPAGEDNFKSAFHTWEHPGWQSKLNATFDRSNDSVPYWIWHTYKADSEYFEMNFKHDFTVNEEVISASLLVAADNIHDTYLNGQVVGSHNNWQEAKSYDVSGKIQSGVNTLAINVLNVYGNLDPLKNPGGLIWKLTYLTKTYEQVVAYDFNRTFNLSIPANLWIAADDKSKVYMNGSHFSNVAGWAAPKKFDVSVDDVPFFAVDAYGNHWYDKDYVAEENWISASLTSTETTWADDADFPAPVSSSWIWSAHNDVPNDAGHIDTPVYLRSVEPLEHVLVNVESEGYTANVKVNGSYPSASVVEGSTVTLTAPDVESHIFKGWYNGAVLVSEDLETSLEVVKDETFTAKYEIKTYVNGDK